MGDRHLVRGTLIGLGASVAIAGLTGCGMHDPGVGIPPGLYLGHGRTLSVPSSGGAEYRFRPDGSCPPTRPGDVCDDGRPVESGRAVLIFSRDDRGALTALVTETNDAATAPPGARLPVETPRPGVLLLGNGDAPVGFCADGATDEACGA